MSSAAATAKFFPRVFPVGFPPIPNASPPSRRSESVPDSSRSDQTGTALAARPASIFHANRRRPVASRPICSTVSNDHALRRPQNSASERSRCCLPCQQLEPRRTGPTPGQARYPRVIRPARQRHLPQPHASPLAIHPQLLTRTPPTQGPERVLRNDSGVLCDPATRPRETGLRSRDLSIGHFSAVDFLGVAQWGQDPAFLAGRVRHLTGDIRALAAAASMP